MTIQQYSNRQFSLTVSASTTTSLSKKDWKILLEIFSDFLGEKSKKFKHLKAIQIECSLDFCSDAKMKKLNREYRNKNRCTDVLSFALFQDLRIPQPLPPILHLGDIFISKEYAKLEARRFKITLKDEILQLIIHGFLHLLGFDHELSPFEEKTMRSIEKRLMVQFVKKLAPLS